MNRSILLPPCLFAPPGCDIIAVPLCPGGVLR
nr:MAG TPA: hypothetical protein [Caudoviricetes sp.]